MSTPAENTRQKKHSGRIPKPTLISRKDNFKGRKKEQAAENQVSVNATDKTSVSGKMA